jgi:hypothetical protein
MQRSSAIRTLLADALSSQKRQPAPVAVEHASSPFSATSLPAPKPTRKPKAAPVATDDRLAAVLDAYPAFPASYRVSPAALRSAYKKAIETGATHEEIISGANGYRLEHEAALRCGGFVPQVKSPLRWLSEKGWQVIVPKTPAHSQANGHDNSFNRSQERELELIRNEFGDGAL